jgi:copper(I)-binding protein
MKCCVFLLAWLALLPLATQAAQADQVKASQAWIRLLPVNLPAGGYVTLENHGASAVTLVSAQSTSYASVMLHESSTDHAGNSGMHMLDRLTIAAHGKVALAPAGYHLMLQQVTHRLKPGDTIEVTLNFADGSHLDVPFLIRPANTDN